MEVVVKVKLATKLTVLIVGLSVSAFVAIALVVYSTTPAVVEESIGKRQTLIARQTMDRIDERMNGAVADIRVLAESQAASELLQQPVLPEGEMGRQLERLASFTGPWSSVKLIDEGGRVVYSSQADEVGGEVGSQEERLAVAEAGAGRVYYSDLIFGANGEETVLFAAPVVVGDRVGAPVLGVVLGHYDWQSVMELMGDIHGRVVLADSEGRVIASNWALVSLPAQIDLPDDLPGAGTKGEAGTDKSRVDGEEVLVAYVRQDGYLDYGGKGWVLVLEEPVNEVLASATAAALRLIGLLTPVLVVGVAINIWLSNRHIIGPIRKLTEAARVIAAGDLTGRVKVRLGDEIGELSEMFNSMVEKLSQLQSGMEKKVADKTRELAEEEARLRMMLETVKEGIVLSDERGKLLVFNLGMQALTGYSWQEADQADDFNASINQGETQEQLWQRMEKLGVGKRREHETTITTRDAREKRVLVSTVLVEHEGRKMLLSVFYDVTGLKTAEAELRREKEGVEKKVEERTSELVAQSRLLEEARSGLSVALEQAKSEVDKTSAVLQSIGEGVFVLDGERKIVVVNKVTEELSGYTKAELESKRYDEMLSFVLESTGEKSTKFIDQVYIEGRVVTSENHTALVRKDGSKILVAHSAAPLKDQEGKIVGCVVVLRDVSKEREVERMKDEFISIASHQLRTPLTALRWVAARLAKSETGPLNEKQTGLVEDIRSSVLRLIDLVIALLNISRIESGRIMVEPEVTNMAELARSVIDELASKFEERRQAVELAAAAELPEISIDPKLIRQVILNLLTNANKYSADDKKVTLAIERTGDELMVKVADQGIGIPEKDQGKVFQKFFRADNVASKETEGSGLGLYLAKQVVEASGGKIGFESRENEGSVFWFALPLSGSQAKGGEVRLTG